MSATIPLEQVKTLTLNIYRFDPGKDEKAYMQDIETVSYTHLTLPTNREV